MNFVSRGDEKSHIQRRKLIALQKRRKEEEERAKIEKEMLVEEELEYATMRNIKPATILKLKKQYEEREKEERLDKDNIMIRTIFINEPTNKKNLRKIFLFYVHKSSDLSDLKMLIKRDFGWGMEQINVFLNYQELEDQDIFANIKEYDNEEDLLMVFINSKRPEIKLQAVVKPKMDDIKMEDVKYFNCSNDNDLIPQSDRLGNKLEYPDFIDWHFELSEISNTVSVAKEKLRSNLDHKESLNLLMEAEVEFRKLTLRFEKSARKAVKTIVETQSTPLNIFNLYGDGGKKYTSGGMIFRHCDGWLYHQKFVLNKKQSKKMATHNLKAYSLLRHKFSSLLIPL